MYSVASPHQLKAFGSVQSFFFRLNLPFKLDSWGFAVFIINK